MALPLYVSLEQIDPRLIEAAKDLYASSAKAFVKVTLPLSLPGIFAGTLLTFIPAAGDFINAQLLGTSDQYMIGNVIQSRFLELTDYPTAAALSFILMAIILADRPDLRPGPRDGEADRMTTGDRGGPGRAPVPRVRTSPLAFVRRHVLTAYSLLVFAYLLLPIVVVVLFSFNEPKGRFNVVWNRFTFDNWVNWDAVSGIRSSIEVSLEVAAIAEHCGDAPSAR